MAAAPPAPPAEPANHPVKVQGKSALFSGQTPKFDLASYIANYKGRSVFRRLHLIASCSTVLQEEAARMAVGEAKKGSDVHNYREAVALLRHVSRGKSGGVDDLVDPTWATQQEKKNAAETARLEGELKGYKNNLIKESIRMGNEDLGNHYYKIGDLNNAVKAYSRMRDYCTTANHIASTAFRIIAVAVEQKNWLAVASQVHKIRNLQMKPDDMARNYPKVQAVTGLQQMSTGEYRDAAFSFLLTEPTLGDSYSDVLTSNDVAVYGGLCALASMSRSELQTRVLENANFRNFLELEPHLRRAINFFCAGKYSQCLDVLESYRADYLLDLYLQPLVADIYQKIRTKSIIQYFQPFNNVTLASMEKMFGGPRSLAGTGPPLFLDEITALIEEGKLDARLDLEHQTLVGVERDPRAEVQEAALDTIDGFVREARMKLVRLQMVHAGLEVKPLPRKKTWDADPADTAWGPDDGAPGAGAAAAAPPLGAGGRDVVGGQRKGG